MTNQEFGPALIMFFHDLFTVVWVGGLIALGIVVVPSARGALGRGTEMQQLMRSVQARLRWFVYASIVGLALTGIMLSMRSDEFQGFFSWGDTYSVALSMKHLVVLAMIAVALVRSVVLARSAPGGPATVRDAAGSSAKIGTPPGPALAPSAPRPERVPGHGSSPSMAARASMALLYLNVVFGVLVLLLSALTAAV